MTTYECAVRLTNDSFGWYGTVMAANPHDAAVEARRKHNPRSSSYAYGDRISHVEVWFDGGRVGNF